MKGLITLASNIKIGNLAVGTVSNIIANKNFGRGLFHNTTNMGIRKANMINNYHYESSYYDIKSKTAPTYSKRYFFGDLIDAPNIHGLDIGWAYTTDINRYSLNIGYVSSADFDNFQNLLRQNILYHGRQGDEYKKLFKGYEKKFIVDNKINNPIYERGNKIIINSNYKQPLKLKTIKDEYDISFYDDKILSKNEGSFWNINKPYIINKSTFERYNIDDDFKLKSDFIVETKDKGSRGLSHVINNKNTNFYYQENEYGNNDISLNNYSITDNSIVLTPDFEERSLLIKKTNELFKNGKIKSLINRFHTDKIENNELISSVDKTYGISRGRNLLKKNPKQKDGDSSYDNPYCRVWTAHHQYSKLKDRIRPFITDEGNFMDMELLHHNIGESLRPNNAPERLKNYGVLQNNGFVKITPNQNDSSESDNKNLKKYMFSIENLAWKDNKNLLSPEQQGPNNGRIMWFPPYNLRFSENVNVNWSPNNFIGRGEQIYTYTNTERSGTLDFTLLIDHPSLVNKWRGRGEIDNKEIYEQTLLRFFAGCEMLEGTIREKDKTNIITEEENNNDIKEIKPISQGKDIAYVLFFPNDYSGNDEINHNIDGVIENLKKYEFQETGGDFSLRDNSYKDELLHPHNYKNVNSGKKLNNFSKLSNNATYKLIKENVFNNNDIEFKSFNELLNIENEFKNYNVFGFSRNNFKIESIDIQGFASSHGNISKNIELCRRRAKTMEMILSHLIEGVIANTKINFIDGEIKEVKDDGNRKDINKINPKLYRAAVVTFHITSKNDIKPSYSSSENEVSSISKEFITDSKIGNRLINEISSSRTEDINDAYTYDNEYLYFSEICDKNQSMVYKHIIDKVRYFDPAFHSITPEGFNARLTFLHQCTRQGPTSSVKKGSGNGYLEYAGNLSFGRAPYCVLRIGDFFNTKICIDSISIQYDNSGVQWDLNPEGVGVQPMYANVSLNFKFVGGQDISGPIERLQNAVSSNYYANASVYDNHADYDNKRFNFDTGEYYK